MLEIKEWLEAPQTKQILKALRKVNEERKSLLGLHIIADPLNADKRGLLKTALEYKAFDAALDSIETGEFDDEHDE
jgi:hypothetical protein